jgi:hypothetical protein
VTFKKNGGEKILGFILNIKKFLWEKIIGKSKSSKLFPKFQKSRNKNSGKFFKITALKSSFYYSEQINRKVINRVL